MYLDTPLLFPPIRPTIPEIIAAIEKPWRHKVTMLEQLLERFARVLMTTTNKRGWIGVDLDGTLAHYDGWKGVDHIGEPVPKMLARVKQWLADGRKVRIFTARVGHRPAAEVAQAKSVIEVWCEKHVGQKLPVTCTKDLAMVELWDDRCTQVLVNTGVPVAEELELLRKTVTEYEKMTGARLNPEWVRLGPEANVKIITKGDWTHVSDNQEPNPDYTTPVQGTYLGAAIVQACPTHEENIHDDCEVCQGALHMMRPADGQVWAHPPEYKAGMWEISFVAK